MNKNNPNPIRDEFEHLEDVQAHLDTPNATWHNVVIQDVDLTSIDALLAAAHPDGCHFLGCEIGPALAAAIAQSQTCLLFPKNKALPFNPYRTKLYAPEELLGHFTTDNLDVERRTYSNSIDWKSYLTVADPTDHKVFTNDSIDTILSRRLHDTSIADALSDLLHTTKKKGVVAIMGGHDMPRRHKVRHPTPPTPLGEELWEGQSDDSVYTRIALLAWKLTNEGYLLVTGGGPGAMEATHLGAWFATRPLPRLRAAIKTLERCPEYKPGQSVEWLIPAMKVRRDDPLPMADEAKCQSIGIPTWFYGHEPPNPFATHIAKYFENSVREEGLLAIATGGVIFAEGNAGTVQEIFQDACQNYYGTYGTAAPMILFGRDYWDPPQMPVYVNDKAKKVYPLVRKLAEEKGFTHRVIVTDSLREILRTLTTFKP
jgi:predicted Rossmann-fold nucleotide-binding protein